MALGDIKILSASTGFGVRGSQPYAVAASATLINSGEPCLKALGGAAVSPLATNEPTVGTDYTPGVACSTSTNTASAAGTVQVFPPSTDTVYLIAPKVAATWDTQSEYDALVGDRVLLDLTAGVYTILATDGANNGCVVMPLDISVYPGLVAFCFRAGCNYLA